jgi:hypothetical protein
VDGAGRLRTLDAGPAGASAASAAAAAAPSLTAHLIAQSSERSLPSAGGSRARTLLRPRYVDGRNCAILDGTILARALLQPSA